MSAGFDSAVDQQRLIREVHRAVHSVDRHGTSHDQEMDERIRVGEGVIIACVDYGEADQFARKAAIVPGPSLNTCLTMSTCMSRSFQPILHDDFY